MRWLVCVMVYLCLAGCAYTPVYGTRPDESASVTWPIDTIRIQERGSERQTRASQSLQNALRDRIEPYQQRGGGGPMSLTVVFTRSVSALSLQQDASVTRRLLKLSATLTLMDTQKPSGTPLFQNTVVASAAFNTPRDPYATLTAEKNAEQRAATLLADNIMTHLAIFLSRS